MTLPDISQPDFISPSEEAEVVRQGEYSRNGDFHRNLDKNWSYYPIYVNKLEVIDELLERHGAKMGKILDAGCGEGVLVEKYLNQGLDITGVDMNYSSDIVKQGSLTALPFGENVFDTVFCLDVLEHLSYADQPVALAHIKRVLKPGGTVIFSTPNLAHFTSRIKFVLRGRLLRTADILHHIGDRPAVEYQELFKKYDYQIIEKTGIFPTIPPLYRFVMSSPAKSVGLLRFLRKMPLPVYWNFQVLFVCKT